MIKIIVVLLMLASLSLNASGQTSIKIISQNTSTFTQANDYYLNLLRQALKKTRSEYGPTSIRLVNTPMTTERQVREVEIGGLTVIWAMTTKQREQRLTAIRIPLLKGLLGYRLLVIRKNEQGRFNHINSIGMLKNMKAIQGEGWLDVGILKDNGLYVESTNWYNSIYKAMSLGHFDYFPRSVLEASAELQAQPYSNLTIEKHLVLVYPCAVYFFVNKTNQKLAKRLDDGLKILMADGSFDQLFYTYPQHKQALKNARLSERQVIHLNNDTLPEDLPKDRRFWFSVSQPEQGK